MVVPANSPNEHVHTHCLHAPPPPPAQRQRHQQPVTATQHRHANPTKRKKKKENDNKRQQPNTRRTRNAPMRLSGSRSHNRMKRIPIQGRRRRPHVPNRCCMCSLLQSSVETTPPNSKTTKPQQSSCERLVFVRNMFFYSVLCSQKLLLQFFHFFHQTGNHSVDNEKYVA